jgi:hypothetical protein
MLDDLKHYRPLDLTVNQIADLQKRTAIANAALKSAAIENLGEPDVKSLRLAYYKGTLTLRFNPAARRAFADIAQMEDMIVRGTIRTVFNLCRSFYFANTDHCPAATLSDYVQEAAKAMCTAIPLYDGTNNFTTFFYYCVKHALLDFVRVEKKHGNVGHDTDLALVPHKQKQTDELYAEAITGTRLDETERRVMNAYLTGDKNWVNKMRVVLANKKTGKSVSRQAVSQHFVEACKKIRATYARMAA